MRDVIAGLVALIIAAAPVANAQTAARLVVFFVDDLHMDFRNTPRLRQLVARLGRELARDGDTWAMATTGHSSISVASNADWNELPVQTTRLVAGGLKAVERQADEVAQRARLTASTAVGAIRQSAGDGRRVVVLYFSSGYVRDVAAELTAVGEAASQARTPIFPIDPRLADGATPVDSAYAAETQESLRALATATGGMTAFTDVAIEEMLTRIRRE